ncbi:hypothetical protein MHLP_01640 [Candidatus Mycoplasma haematolamae str. Purdue]|uniref:Lipoprotein n=1 Tax=Mycoplasma haematolamae (strain Purdue) TaxID=1212765 RepID=I7BJ94_MYCHA|nr:hypothetical protein [Candidatus Mycoplasma haematolamae]AFO51908.1 hypothetical protein MHLP_01640 [Candidatus Mycoplasma haematolamae str. Purdue]
MMLIGKVALGLASAGAMCGGGVCVAQKVMVGGGHSTARIDVTSYATTDHANHKPHNNRALGCIKCNDEEDHEVTCGYGRDNIVLECGYKCPFTNADAHINSQLRIHR